MTGRCFFDAFRFVPAETPSGLVMEHAEFDVQIDARSWIGGREGFYDVIVMGSCERLRRVHVR